MIMLRQKTKATNMMRQKMLGLFEALDIDKDGEITFEEFQVIAEIPPVQMWLASMGVETDDLTTLFVLIDDDRSGLITVDEFVTRMPRIAGPAKGIDVLKLDS